MTDLQEQEREDHILDCYALIKEKDAVIASQRAALQSAVDALGEARSNYIAGSEYDIAWDTRKASVIADATELLSPQKQDGAV